MNRILVDISIIPCSYTDTAICPLKHFIKFSHFSINLFSTSEHKGIKFHAVISNFIRDFQLNATFLYTASRGSPFVPLFNIMNSLMPTQLKKNAYTTIDGLSLHVIKISTTALVLMMITVYCLMPHH